MLKDKNNFAFFPGSFLPFHKGHEYVYNKAKEIFNNIIIVKAKNPIKNSFHNIKDNIPYQYIIWDDLIPILCEKTQIFNIVRGYRDARDYLYEKQLCLTYRILNSKINFTLIFTNDDVRHLNSKNIRRLKNEKVMKLL